MDSTDKTLAVIGILGLAVITIAIGPLLAIWSWNTLFGNIQSIEYSFTNWFAVALLGMFIRGVKIERKK